VPVLMIITWRGFKGKDAPEHLIMGKKMPEILKAIGVPFKVLSCNFRRDIDWALKKMDDHAIPVALILKKGIIDGD